MATKTPVAASMARPVGRQNSATVFDQGFCVACSYSLMRPPTAGRRLICSREGPAIGWSGREGGPDGCDGIVFRCSGP